MNIPGWLLVLLGASMTGLVVACYWLLLQNGHLLLRIEALEKSTPVPGIQTPEGQAFWRFSVGNGFEAGSIWHSVFLDDEYKVRKMSLGRQDVVVDVGAHIGCLSYLCYSLGSRSIYSYEASERNFQLLKTNLGHLPGVHLFHIAVWRSDLHSGEPLLISGPDGENTGAASAMAAGRIVDFPSQDFCDASAPGCSVPTLSLDQILAAFPRVKLLKLDCEGSEFPILLTSRELHRVERIVAEVHEIGAPVFSRLEPRARIAGYSQYRIQDLVARLEAAGFRTAVRSSHPHMHWIDAVRTVPATKTA